MVGILYSASLLIPYTSRSSFIPAGGIKLNGDSKRQGLPASISPNPATNGTVHPITAVLLAIAASAVVLSGQADAAELTGAQPQAEAEAETLSNIPQTLSSECGGGGDCAKKDRIQRPKSRQAETCTVKCVNTCIRGGSGEGPFNIRRPLVVFKDGFRSRHYCLVECSDICNLIRDGEDGP